MVDVPYDPLLQKSTHQNTESLRVETYKVETSEDTRTDSRDNLRWCRVDERGGLCKGNRTGVGGIHN